MLRVLSVLLMTYALLVTCVKAYLHSPCNPSNSSERGLCVERNDCDLDDDTIIGDHPPIPDTTAIACPSSLVCCKPRPEENTTPPIRPVCGMLDRTAGDTSAPGWKEARQIKWNVAFMFPLGLEDGLYKMLYVANGVLIHERAVLTSGMNVMRRIEAKRNNMELYAVMGDYDQTDMASNRKALLVEEILVHKSFNPSRRTYNIAIAFLKSSALVLAPTAVPVCLPPQGHQVAQGTRCFFTGWGDSRSKDPYILTMTKVPKLDAENCTARLRGPHPLGLGRYYTLAQTLTCAGGEPEVDLCTGTEGSPLVCPLQNNPEQYTLVGLMSYVKCGKVARPAVFTDVSNFRNWIEEEIAKRNLTMQNGLLVTAISWLATVYALLPARRHKFAFTGSDEQLLSILQTVDRTTYPPVSEAPITTNEKKGCGWAGDSVSVLLRISPDATEIERAKFGELKWTVAIFNKHNNSYTCVGSLIHPSVVLTVGHWFSDPSTWQVRAGDWKLSANTELHAHQTRDVGEVVVHPKMNKGQVINDIALLFLKEPFAPAPHIGYICLPPQGAVEPTGEVCKATGWGHDKYKGQLQDILKEIELPIVARTECQTRLRDLWGMFFELHSTHVCAGGAKGEDTCQGDGGSPLVCTYKDIQNRYYQIGLAAGGFKCGQKGIPALYTNVASLRNWIDEKVVQKGYTTDSYTA